MKTRYLTILTTLACIGFSISAIAAKPVCPGDPRCKPDNGDPPAEYTAALILGAFRFGAVDITLNKKGNSYSSTVSLDMVRPSDGFAVPSGQENWGPNDQSQWDAVFAVCPELFSGNVVGSVMPSDNWSIDNGGVKNAGKAGTNISIVFRDVIVPGFLEADLDFSLRGVIGLGNELPPESGSPSLVELTGFRFFGAGDPPESCKSGDRLLSKQHNFLEITRK